MSCRQCAPGHDQAAVGHAREGRDVALDLFGIAGIERCHVHSERRRHRLDRCELAESRRRWLDRE